MKQNLLFLIIISMLFAGCTGKTGPDSIKKSKKVNGYVYSNYLNENIGINLRYPSDWHIVDDQEKINDAGLAFLRMEIENVFILLIQPSKNIPNKHEFEKLKQPITILQVIPFPAKRNKLPKNFLHDSVNYEITVMKKEDNSTSIIDGPRNIDINGKEWITYSAAMETQNGYMKSYSYVSTDGEVYKFSALCKLDKMEQYKDYFEQIIESVKLVENLN